MIRPLQFKTFLLVALLVLIGISSCMSPAKLSEQGNYDGAIRLAVKRLQGKRKKKAKHVATLETAFSKVTNKEMRIIESLKKEGRGENWERINTIHRRMANRQALIEPLLPLIDDNGYKAEFRFVRVEDMQRESKKKAAEFLYANASKLLRDAQKGDKRAAREAWSELDKISNYYSTFRDRDALMNQARHLGTTRVFVKMVNTAQTVLPRAFEKEILRISVQELNSGWTEYFLSDQKDTKFEYNVIMKINQIAVSPEQVKEREYQDSKLINDGFEYVLDDEGNVKKDTLGNDVKVPKKKTVSATVYETFQNKAARVGGVLEFYNNASRDLMKSIPIAVDAVFDHYASTYRGDKRALSKETRTHLGNKPLPFPTDGDLLIQSAELLKPQIKQQIVNHRNLFY